MYKVSYAYFKNKLENGPQRCRGINSQIVSSSAEVRRQVATKRDLCHLYQSEFFC